MYFGTEDFWKILCKNLVLVLKSRVVPCQVSWANAAFTPCHTCQHSRFSQESPVFHTHLPLSLPFCCFSFFCMAHLNLVIWIITSIYYSKVVQLPDLVWNASYSHNQHFIQISTYLWPHPGKLQPKSAQVLRTLNQASVVEMEGEDMYIYV